MHLITTENAAGYLREAGLIAGPAVAEALGWGVSNVVLRVTPEHGPAVVLKQSRELLRTRAEWRSRLDRIWREADVLRLLGERVPGVAPQLLFEDRPNYVIVMEAIDAAHVVWKESLLAGHVEPSLADTLGELLARIHAATWHDPVVAELVGDQRAFDELRLDPYYRYLAAAHPALAPELRELVEASQSRRHALVLADFSPKNILLIPGGLKLVDFETGHYGDPPFDLGFFLAHLALKGVRAGPADVRCFDFALRFWDVYARALAPQREEVPDFETWCVRHWLACLLARVDGKSPVDYLDQEQQQVVRGFVLDSGLLPSRQMAEAVGMLRTVMGV